MAQARKASDGIAAMLVSELARTDAQGPEAEYVETMSDVYKSARMAERTLFSIWNDYLSHHKEYDKFQHYIGY